MAEQTATAVAEGPQETASPETTAEATAMPANPFGRQDIEQFDADDVSAGRAIGKMLSLFFLYTVIIMSLAAVWTYSQ